VFWRTAGSGARAKTRSKTQQATFGQYGDIQATDPIGQPLIDLCTIELKRGYNTATIHNILDRPKPTVTQEYEKFIYQAALDATNAGSKYWMLITKRDRRQPLVCIPFKLYKGLKSHMFRSTYIKLKHFELFIYIMPLDLFLSSVTPDNILELNE
jgi:hypothetical protein